MTSGYCVAAKKIAVALVFSAAVFLACSRAFAAEEPVYKNPAAPVEDRVEDLLKRLTLDEKMSLIHGDSAIGTSMDTAAVERLGIPRFSMTDGPHGVRWGASTAFPVGVNMASTWNEELMEKMGAALARETLAKGRNVILGPCVNIHRVPFGGRNFESFTEDPYLAGRIAVGYIKGVQSKNVVATVKHFLANNQEVGRMTVSVEADERTLQEIYLPHFKAAVQEGGSLAVMCSYNKINGVYACENKHALMDILKIDWGFKGLVMSDWGATHSTLGNGLNGLDIEMPNGAFMGDSLLKEVKAGNVPESAIDDKVRRNLRVMFLSGIFDGKSKGDSSWTDDAENRAAALQVARESIILLKNENNLLPLDRSKIKSIAVIGPNAEAAIVGGGGSSAVSPVRAVGPLEGIKKLAGDNVKINYVMGCDLQTDVAYETIPAEFLRPSEGGEGKTGLSAKYFSGALDGELSLSRVESGVDINWRKQEPPAEINRGKFAARWTGKIVPPVTGEYTFVSISNGESHLTINGKSKINAYTFDRPGAKSAKVKLQAGREYDIKYEYVSTGWDSVAKLGWAPPGLNTFEAAAKAAAESDVAIVIAGLDASIEGEGHDRDSIELPGRQNELIKTVAAANPNTVVVLVNGTPVIINSWLQSARSLIEAWYPGEEEGTALAEILFGDTNPSGKLTITWPNSWEESPAYGNYPGTDGKVHYSEGIFVGYRYYDTKGVKPVFPFGHGMSYTSFKYSNLKISKKKMTTADEAIEATVDITNAGGSTGSEVVQLYVRDIESSVPRPAHELKGVRKIELKPGETKTVTFKINRAALSFFDPATNKWVAEPGEFELQAAASSADIRLKETFHLSD